MPLQRFPLESTSFSLRMMMMMMMMMADSRQLDPISDLYGGSLSQPFVVFVRRGIFVWVPEIGFERALVIWPCSFVQQKYCAAC
jgi:hypothetical protein